MEYLLIFLFSLIAVPVLGAWVLDLIDRIKYRRWR